MKPIVVLPLIVVLVLGVVFLGALTGGSDPDRPSPWVGRQVPEFTVPPLERTGRPADARGLSAEDLKDGRVKLVNFWASWCAPCRVEHPVLTRLAEEGVPVHGIVYKDRVAAAQQFLTALGDPFERVGFDKSGRAAIEWGVSGVPESFLIDGDGQILWHHVGELTPIVIDKKIRPLFEQASARSPSANHVP